MAYGIVERRRRALARLALYGSLIVVGCLTSVARYYLRLPPKGSGETRWLGVDWASLPAVRLLQQYIRVDSSPESGDPYAAALFLSTPLEAAGLDVHVERVGARQALLWAELRGRDPHALVLLSHMDVEGVGDRPAWVHPPFGGTLDPPWLYGRGAFDMKSYTAAQMLALLRLAARREPPARSVILLATSDEESGSDLGMRWFVRQHPELVRRFWAVMTEGGVVEARTVDDPKYWGIDVGQKRFVELVACAPTRTRLQELQKDLAQRAHEPGQVVVDPGVAQFWRAYSASRDVASLRTELTDPEQFLRDPAGLMALPGYLRSTLRNEIAVFHIEPAAAGAGFQMKLLLHLLPNADIRAAWRELLPPWLTAGVQVTLRDVPPPSVLSPFAHPLVDDIAREVRTVFPHVIVGPYFHPVTATDSRFLRALGVPSYGFSPFVILTPDTEHMHRSNERIPLTTYVDGVELYQAIVAGAADNSRQPK